MSQQQVASMPANEEDKRTKAQILRQNELDFSARLQAAMSMTYDNGQQEEQEVEPPKPQPKIVEQFTMPRPRLHESVYWYRDGDKHSAPHPAIVIAVDPRSVRLLFLSPDRFGQWSTTGIRHINDPELLSRPNMRIEFGAWSFQPNRDQLKNVVEALDQTLLSIEGRLNAIEAQMEKTTKKKTGE